MSYVLDSGAMLYRNTKVLLPKKAVRTMAQSYFAV